jgi:hypothetical protein
MRFGIYFKRIVQIAALGAIGLAVYKTPYDPPARTPQEISDLSDIVNEAAAVIVPHKTLGKEIRSENLALFEKVERGAELSEEESAQYRGLYQKIVFNNQRFFWSYDHQVTVMADVGMQMANNVGGHGVAGRHDHHDASARINLELLKGNLARIDSASGAGASFVRIYSAIKAYKNLTDLMLHFGTVPQTVSVGYMPPAAAPDDSLAAGFETMLRDYKKAQFAPVNSPAYVSALHAALGAYDGMIMETQNHVRSKLSPWERTLAGRWLSWQSLTPPMDAYHAYRFPRHQVLTAAQ